MMACAISGDITEGTDEKELGIPLFLLCCFRTTGTNLLTDDVSEIAVMCWPYQEHVPSFHYQILTERTTYIASNCRKHGQFPHATTEFCRWIEKTTNEASAHLKMKLYPVLFAHGGDSSDFLFFFRSCAKHGIDLKSQTSLPIHFADPVPLLDFLKLRRHPLLAECKCLTLGSLLNDWFPGLFDPADLKNLPSRAKLTSKLYTQTTLYPILHKVPIYNITEWTEYYDAAINYKEDKRLLESHMPKHLRDVQVKFAVRGILRAGYNWEKLLDLFKACVSPLQFRQEVRDMDVQSSIARDISWMITDMKLEQTGTRPYVVKIKPNMPPQEYIGYKDPRGYYFVLRVANKFPQCYLTLADLEYSLKDHPISTPTGFSFSQRLGPRSLNPESGKRPSIPVGHDYNGNEIFDLFSIDPEVYKDWIECETDISQETEDYIETYCQAQLENYEKTHEITSFVMGAKINQSLLMNCMEFDELPSRIEPTDEEKIKRSQMWASVRENLDPSYQPSVSLEQFQGDLSKSNKEPEKPDKAKRRSKGSKKRCFDKNRGYNERKEWNMRQDGDRDKPWNNEVKSKVLLASSVVPLPGGEEGGGDGMMTLRSVGTLGRRVGAVNSPDDKRERLKKEIKSESTIPVDLEEFVQVLSKSVQFLDHPSGIGVDIIYPRSFTSKRENSSERNS